MYKQEVQHKVKFELVNDRPKITIGIRFNDIFNQDTYMLISESPRSFNKNKINFNFLVNNNKKGIYSLNNLDVETFLKECFSTINDYDFHEYFTDEIKSIISNQINENMYQYEQEIILNEISYEGELQRIKELSGLKRKLL